MTRAQALAAVRRGFLPALVAGLLVLVAVAALLLTRPAAYQTRVSLVAAPTGVEDQAAPDYGSVVSLGMPAVPELAVSTPVLERVASTAPQVDRPLLESSVAIEVVPASGVARVTVTAEDPATARRILEAVVDEVQGSDLLDPVARFEVVGDLSEEPVQRDPDPLLALGLAALAAGVVATCTLAALQLLRPRLLTVHDVQEAVRTETGQDVPVVAVGRGEPDLALLRARLDLTVPGTRTTVAVPAGEVEDRGVVEALNALLHAQRRPSGGPEATAHSDSRTGSNGTRNPGTRPSGGDPAAVVLVRLGRTSGQDLAKALATAQQEDRPVGLVLAT